MLRRTTALLCDRRNLAAHCRLLGVSSGATEAEVKKRYHALVKQYHPDIRKGDRGSKLSSASSGRGSGTSSSGGGGGTIRSSVGGFATSPGMDPRGIGGQQHQQPPLGTMGSDQQFASADEAMAAINVAYKAVLADCKRHGKLRDGGAPPYNPSSGSASTGNGPRGTSNQKRSRWADTNDDYFARGFKNSETGGPDDQRFGRRGPRSERRSTSATGGHAGSTGGRQGKTRQTIFEEDLRRRSEELRKGARSTVFTRMVIRVEKFLDWFTFERIILFGVILLLVSYMRARRAALRQKEAEEERMMKEYVHRLRSRSQRQQELMNVPEVDDDDDDNASGTDGSMPKWKKQLPEAGDSVDWVPEFLQTVYTPAQRYLMNRDLGKRGAAGIAAPTYSKLVREVERESDSRS